VTVVLETGNFPISGPEVKLVLDTPAGLVHATTECEDHKVAAVTLQNVPSFVILSDVEGIGRITCDIAYDGNFDAHPAGRASRGGDPPGPGQHAHRHRAAHPRRAQRVRRRPGGPPGEPRHPRRQPGDVYRRTDEPEGAHKKNMVLYGPGGLDRSP
jgi:proline racemase